MKKYLFSYRPDLFWNWCIQNTKDKNESYVLTVRSDAIKLLNFLENKETFDEIPESIQKIILKSFTVEEITMKQKKREKVLAWFVDVQNDFMNPDGALYVQDAEKIIPNINKLVEKYIKNDIQKVFTADLHFENSEELSENPDFITKFPKHCMVGTKGAMIIEDVLNQISPNFEDVQWNEFYNYQDLCEIAKSKNIVITKDKFDVFTGNQYTDKLLEIINPDVIYVCGVASNVCVDKAIMGILQREKKVYVITNAIKELPNISLKPIIDKWVSHGAILV